MTFQIDTTGEIVLPYPHLHPEACGYRWSDLSPFTQGYIEALFADLPGLDDKGRMIPRHPDVVPGVHVMGFSDLAPETLARIIADCEAMDVLRPGVSEDGDRSAGRGFWELRQSGAYADRFPPLTIQLCDDGKVRFAA